MGYTLGEPEGGGRMRAPLVSFKISNIYKVGNGNLGWGARTARLIQDCSYLEEFGKNNLVQDMKFVPKKL